MFYSADVICCIPSSASATGPYLYATTADRATTAAAWRPATGTTRLSTTATTYYDNSTD